MRIGIGTEKGIVVLAALVFELAYSAACSSRVATLACRLSARSRSTL